MVDDGPENSRYKWRHARCPFCGCSYRDFRAPDQPTFREAQVVVLINAKSLAEAGDYSKPCRRAAILGYMHQWKRTFWELHAEMCERALHEESASSSRQVDSHAVP